MSLDYLIETDQLKRRLTDVLEGGVLNQRGAELHHNKRLVHVEAGIKVRDLLEQLDRERLTLLTLGGADGQSLAGVLSTSVHGSDFDRGPIPDMVRAIHLVGPGGEQYWLEPSSGITQPDRVQAKLGIPRHNIRYDDDWFNSVLVSMGSLGIIYSLIVEVAPQHDLVETTEVIASWESMRARLASGQEFTGGRRALQVAVDPSSPHACFLVARKEAPATLPFANTGVDPLALFCQGILDPLLAVAGVAIVPLVRATFPFLTIPLPFPIGVLPWELFPGALSTALRTVSPGALGNFVAAVLDSHPDWTAQLISLITRDRMPAGVKRGWAHTIMAGPDQVSCASRGLSIELAFNAGDHAYLEFLDEALRILDAARAEGLVLGGWFSIRFVGRSRAYLSPQRWNRTCTVEVVGLAGLRSTPLLLSRLEQAARRHGGIPHWGMFLDLNADEVLRAYPELQHWLRVRHELTRGGVLRTFDNAFTERCGLSRLPDGLNVVSTRVRIKTAGGYLLTATNAGGLGGTNDGSAVNALHTDATAAGPWEQFAVEWVDEAHGQFALRTINGNYLTAVNGGGIGAPHGAAKPIHTDATRAGPWEEFQLNVDSRTQMATLQTSDGHYVTAVNGGGVGGEGPINTDARWRGPWELFTLV